MKLIKFDTSNCVTTRNGASTISLDKNGVISFNKFSTAKCEFVAGDKIAIFQDEENPYDWYVAKDENGFELRWTNPGIDDAVKTNSAALCKMFKEALNYPQKAAVSCLIAGEPTKVGKTTYWGILTNTASWRGKI